MSHAKTKIWLHVVFSTKNRLPFLTPPLRGRVHGLLREELIKLGCYVRIVNGVDDHVHLLFSLTPRLSVQDALKQIKGSTSHAVNQQDWLPEKFAWQTGYGAFSVSEGHLERVHQYTANQEEHHRTITFATEHAKFMKHYGLEASEGE